MKLIKPSFYTYKIISNIPDKPFYYFGVRTCKYLPDNRYMGSGIKLKQIYKEYGINNFIKTDVVLHSSYEKALENEKNLIGHLFETDKWCLNLSGGGLHGRELSKEQKRKISFSMKGKNSGDSNPMKKYPHTLEIKNKIRQSRLGKTWSNEVKIKMSNSKTKKIMFNGIIYSSFKECSIVNKIPLPTLSRWNKQRKENICVL